MSGEVPPQRTPESYEQTVVQLERAAHEAGLLAIRACEREAYGEYDEDGDDEPDDGPVMLGLGCGGCDDCIVREVLMRAWPSLQQLAALELAMPERARELPALTP